jgi:DNA-binding transcriptional regulator YdaS (Cro superfamily)
MLTTVDSIIEALGGSTAAAAIVGVGPSAISNWKTRGGIPSDKFMLVERALADRGKDKPSPNLFGFEMPSIVEASE